MSAKIAAMQFLYDLDVLTVLLTGLTLALVSGILALLWISYEGRWPKDGGVIVVLLFLVPFSLIHAYKSYCPDADQPHIRRTGPVHMFKPYRYPEGKHYDLGILECVGPCGKGIPFMEFDERATAAVVDRDPSAPLTVTYLGRMEEADLQNGFQITAHPAVEIDDSVTGERLFYVDTTRHWPRTIMLLADSLICIVTFVYCLKRVETGPSQADSSSDES